MREVEGVCVIVDFDRRVYWNNITREWRRPFFPLFLGFITVREEKGRNQNICRCFFSKIKNHTEKPVCGLIPGKQRINHCYERQRVEA